MLGHLQQDKDYNEVSDVLDAIRENTDKAPKKPSNKLEWNAKEQQVQPRRRCSQGAFIRYQGVQHQDERLHQGESNCGSQDCFVLLYN